MRTLLAAALSLAAACGGSSPHPSPAPVEPAAVEDRCGVAATDGKPTDATQCECLGYRVFGDIGDGQVACPEGASEVARIAYGIEGGVCCAVPPATTSP
ncbi:MAG: hypothetical protein R3B06_24710 [Kofleriaceae bacterium]